MKKTFSLLLLAVLAMGLFTACGDDSDSKSPTDVAKDFVSAWEKQDSGKIEKLACEDLDEEDIATITSMKIEFKDVKYAEVDKKDDSVTIHVTGTMSMDVEGTAQEAPLELDIPMEKKSGDWCIADTGA